MDGIDAALVRLGDHTCKVVATHSHAYPDDLAAQLRTLSRSPADCTVDKIGHLDHWIGECFGEATMQLLNVADKPPENITAIGSHGQTLRHQPRASRPFTLQIGDPNLIALNTGIATVADFRRRDVAAGGEGAPLTPAFHEWLFRDATLRRVILNIGGIANVTVLGEPGDSVIGYDTGPGNSLLDGWIRSHQDHPFDEAGRWAAEGNVNETLLGVMLSDPYFAEPPPKSTGFEYFNGGWVRARVASLGDTAIEPADVQATLSELTARTIATSILGIAPDVSEVLVCGGGIHNTDLQRRLGSYLSGIEVTSTESYGLHPDWVEAAAFAWLAMRRLAGEPGNLPDVTGANGSQVLGGVFSGTG